MRKSDDEKSRREEDGEESDAYPWRTGGLPFDGGSRTVAAAGDSAEKRPAESLN